MDGRELHFRLGGVNNQNFLMYDEETGSWWQQVSGDLLCDELIVRQIGVQGANQLLLRLERANASVATLVLPNGIKDVRQCVQSRKNADWLADQIGKLSETSSPKHGATHNVNEK